MECVADRPESLRKDVDIAGYILLSPLPPVRSVVLLLLPLALRTGTPSALMRGRSAGGPIVYVRSKLQSSTAQLATQSQSLQSSRTLGGETSSHRRAPLPHSSDRTSLTMALGGAVLDVFGVAVEPVVCARESSRSGLARRTLEEGGEGKRTSSSSSDTACTRASRQGGTCSSCQSVNGCVEGGGEGGEGEGQLLGSAWTARIEKELVPTVLTSPTISSPSSVSLIHLIFMSGQGSSGLSVVHKLAHSLEALARIESNVCWMLTSPARRAGAGEARTARGAMRRRREEVRIVLSGVR